MVCQFQRTIQKPVQIKGIGLHSGLPVTLKLLPARANDGINFIKNGVIIPAKVGYAHSFEFSTSLYNDGETVRTVEHLMAALYLTGIDNLYIEIDNEEVPILDGSAKPFIEAIKKAGIYSLKEEKVYAVLNSYVRVENGDKFIEGRPYHTFRATFQADYPNNIIGNKFFTYEAEKRDTFLGVSAARTYCFLEEVEYLKSKGLAKGGSLENAVVFDSKTETVLNPDGLRYEDEPVRHKVLDLIGDLYLLGYPIIGDVYSFKGGHKLNAEFVKTLIAEDAFDFKTASEVIKSLNVKRKECPDVLGKVA